MSDTMELEPEGIDNSDFASFLEEEGMVDTVLGDTDGDEVDLEDDDSDDDGLEHGSAAKRTKSKTKKSKSKSEDDDEDAADDDSEEDVAPTKRVSKGPRLSDGDDDSEDTDDDDETAADEQRRAGQERLAVKLSQKERELTAASRRIRELEGQLNERRGPDVDLLDDRLGYVRTAIARGLGLKADDPRVKEELTELLDDLVFADVSDELIQSNDKLREQYEARRTRQASRKDRIALERRMAELERREVEAQAAESRARTVGQLTGYLTQRADDLPFLSNNPDGNAADLVYMGLQSMLQEGHDLSTDQAVTAAVEHIVDSLEDHYRGVAERYISVVKRRKSAAIDLDDADGPEKRSGDQPKKRSGGKRGATLTSAKGSGGRGSAPPRRQGDPEDETFEDFYEQYMAEQRATRRRPR